MLGEMETVLRRFRPAWVDIFMLTPTQLYIDRHFGGSHDAIWAHLKRASRAVMPPALPDLAARTGYVVRMGSGHHMMLKRADQGVAAGSARGARRRRAANSPTPR